MTLGHILNSAHLYGQQGKTLVETTTIKNIVQNWLLKNEAQWSPIKLTKSITWKQQVLKIKPLEIFPLRHTGYIPFFLFFSLFWCHFFPPSIDCGRRLLLQSVQAHYFFYFFSLELTAELANHMSINNNNNKKERFVDVSGSPCALEREWGHYYKQELWNELSNGRSSGENWPEAWSYLQRVTEGAKEMGSVSEAWVAGNCEQQ